MGKLEKENIHIYWMKSLEEIFVQIHLKDIKYYWKRCFPIVTIWILGLFTEISGAIHLASIKWVYELKINWVTLMIYF